MTPNVISAGELTSLAGNVTTFPGPADPLLIDGRIDTFQDFRDYLTTSASVSPLMVWSTQPSVRKVVDFVARAVASTPLKVYRRVADNDRERVTGHPLTNVLNAPSPGVIPYRFWHSIIVDWLLYDRWLVLKVASGDDARPVDLVRVQAERVTFTNDGLGRVNQVWVDTKESIETDDCILDHGYSPMGAHGTSPMRTLAAILQESTEAVAYRRSIWKNSARVPVVLQRPASAPQWSNDARDRFLAGWRAYVSSGGNEGGTPLLQDGMTLAKVDAFTPKDTNDIAGRQLTDAEVAAAFHIAPELVGARQGTYSNVEAFRQMLYRDGLGPLFAAWEQTINAMLTPDLDSTGLLYVEADVDAKLRGSFQEEATVMSTATGGPWLTRNEARARKNLPAVDGGDELIVPLNVATGGQASPQDSGSQNVLSGRTGGVKAPAPFVRKAKPDTSTYQERAEKVLADFVEHQRQVVLSALGAKAVGEAWDAERWDDELGTDLFDLAASIANEVGPSTAEALGYSANDYDVERTVAYLRKASETRATNINATTLAHLDAALASDDENATPAAVFDEAATRGASAATQIVTATVAFGAIEAGKQVGGGEAVKTWETGPHPRPSHAQLNGSTVGIDEPFSNGLMWPGDGGDADEVAGCNCGVSVSVP